MFSLNVYFRTAGLLPFLLTFDFNDASDLLFDTQDIL